MRRTAREIAIKMLFQKEFTTAISPREWPQYLQEEDSFSKPIPTNSNSATSASISKAATEIPKESLRFAEILVAGVSYYQKEIDSIIKSCAQHWSLDRMATLDRNILRMGVFEIKFAKEPTPPSVAINEAVEIAKVYGSKESAGFINGILDQIQKNNNVNITLNSLLTKNTNATATTNVTVSPPAPATANNATETASVENATLATAIPNNSTGANQVNNDLHL